MANLIDSLLLVTNQLSIDNSVLFQEKTYLISGSQEVVIANMIVISSGELCLLHVAYMVTKAVRFRM